MRHGFDIPDGDILIHSGDATFRGDRHEVIEFAAWFRNQPHKHKVFVAGNHELSFEDIPKQAQQWLQSYDVDNGGGYITAHEADEKIIYLQDSSVEITEGDQTVKIYGAPWQPYFGGWAFNLHTYTGELKQKWSLIPDDTDILVTHGPPYKLRDTNTRGQHCGCRDLRQAIERIKPALHVCGHIHEGYGTEDFRDTVIANASVCNHKYKAVNKPLTFEYADGKVYETREIQGQEETDE